MHGLSGFCFRMNLVGFLKQKGARTGLETISDGWERQALFTGIWLRLFLTVPTVPVGTLRHVGGETCFKS